jgi:replication-associated recombination protein RarA
VGSGKTALVHAIANELDIKVMEINASSVRSRSAILSIFGEASQSRHIAKFADVRYL